ncbi:MAG: hypothetical protein ACR2N3_01055 [Pyrinomonadaceae bacterium]
MAISNTNEQITIDLPIDVKTALERKAKGKDIKVYIQGIITKQALRPSLNAMLAPIRQEFTDSGMSEDDLDVFMNSVRDKAYHDKEAK